ncbi:MAG: hypothetical protein H6517_03270 [Microthrixaceae bacterium]|nr:hypothetical protein [Microthrixaceae bacterium]
MIAVTSKAFTIDEVDAASGYESGIRDFWDFHAGQPGFRGRLLMRSRSDRTSFTHVRFFDSVRDYEQMIKRPGYAEHINALAKHLRPHPDAPGKDYVDVVVGDWPDGAGAPGRP